MKRPLCLTVAIWAVSSCVVAPAWSLPQSSKPKNSKSEKLRPETTLPVSASVGPAATATIPGPLRSFLRMAAVSQKVSPEQVLPLVARNVSLQGYQNGKPTEFLVLLRRYLDQARELVVLAGPSGVIHVPNCSEAKPVLAILGYRMREACGPKTALETSDPDRAFLTIDSGFPLAELEETLRGGKALDYPYRSSQVPVIFAADDWETDDKGKKEARKRGKDDAVDLLLRDGTIARMYWAMSRIDPETSMALRKSPGVRNLLPYAAALDFYGSQFLIREGRVVVPGGPAQEGAWKDLVGASPESPGEFLTKLLATDEGWLAAYFDVLSRIPRKQQVYFAESHHLPRFYQALRGEDILPSPSRPVFRPDPGLLLLTTRLEIEPNGQPHVPGGVEVWKTIVLGHHGQQDSKIAKAWAKRASHWNSAEQVVEGMFGLSRVTASGGAFQIFLTASEIDRGRIGEQRLSSQTTRLLADKFSRFSDQYPVFAEFSGLSNLSIVRFLTASEAVDKIGDHSVRSNAMGIFQAEIGLWEVLARQGEISRTQLNNSWQKVTDLFVGVRSSAELFDAGRSSWNEILRAAGGKAGVSQDEAIALLAAPPQSSPDGQQVRQQISGRIRTVMDDQRLLSLDTLFGLADGLHLMAEGRPATEALLAQAQQLREFEMPKPFFTTTERREWSAGLYNTSHATLQMRTDLTKIMKAPGSPAELTGARGDLTPFLRDTLVGLNYAYYEPPSAQTLHSNPLLVRSHDFSGEMTPGSDQAWRVPRVFGRGWAASGGAHLTGSLADLPYVLAQMEQDFTVPENVQALIWEELVPGLVSGAVIPRWWGIPRDELHLVALYQRAGEELLAASATDEKLRREVMGILSERMLSDRAGRIADLIRMGPAKELIPNVTPSEKFYLASEFRNRFSSESASLGDPGRELDSLVRRDPEGMSMDRLSRDFGVPHPVLEQSYGRELLNVKPFPAFMGFPSRLLAETWDSDNLYWARLADEKGVAPEMLNRLVPVLTHRMIEKIFATDFEDSLAVLRALRETGEEFERGEIVSPEKSEASAGDQ